jgi:DNA (cytosine-5)-methyltransferase 1
MKDQFCLRSIPADLWKWLEERAFAEREKLNETVIFLLEQARSGGPPMPLFEPKPVQPTVHADAIPFKFIDLFAGIGGFRVGLQRAGGQCVFTSEWDRWAQKTYKAWHGEEPVGDITQVEPSSIPDHDVLAAGFPCQPFSIAGVSKKRSLGQADGFRCERQGNLFFRICDIVDAKRPPVLILENVKNLQSHDKGVTWGVIQQELRDRRYKVNAKIIDAALYVPQHRERIFIVCFDQEVFGENPPFEYPPEPKGPRPKFADILEPKPDDKYTLTDHLWKYLQAYAKKHQAAGNGFGFGIADPKGVSRTLSARYYKDGSEILIAQSGKNPRRLTLVEAARLMGYGPYVRTREDIPVSDTQAYRQFGNSVVPLVVEAVAKQVVQTMRWAKEQTAETCYLKGAKKAVASPTAPAKPSERSKAGRRLQKV